MYFIYELPGSTTTGYQPGKKKKKHVKNLTAMQELQETWVQSLGWEGPLKDEMATHSSILD